MGAKYNRRDFLRLGAGVGAGLAMGGIAGSGCTRQLAGAAARMRAAPMETVRIGLVGAGKRGFRHLEALITLEGVQILAIDDIVEEKVARAQRWVEEAGKARPAGYSRGERDFERMCECEELDLVITATPWRWHVPVCLAAMKAGKHAATEVPAAVTMDECWQLVETAEKTGRLCIMLENCCYGRDEMTVLNMVRKGLFGELLHGEAGYMHDLRNEKLSSSGEGLWRGDHSVKRNGNLYPTHGLGPVAQCMNINRGNQFDYLVSMSTKSRGLSLYANKHLGPQHPRAKVKYRNGDVNSSLIRTVDGQTIVLQHDCDTPRPYSRINIVQGTAGIFRGFPEPLIYIEEKSLAHEWEPLDNYAQQYEHPLWQALGEKAKTTGGHSGMDYIMMYRLIKALRTGTPPDMDVYDAAALSVVSELSERSVANKSRPIDFPDFTRGAWKKRKPLGIIGA